MFNYLQRLLGERGLAPHGFCLLWEPALIWTHVIADAAIGAAYFSIPIAIAAFLTRRRDVGFGWVVWMFAAFIMVCGTTHFMSIWTLWHPDYGIEALIKVVTAVVSVFTAVALWPLLPRAIAVPSATQLQRANEALSLRIVERDTALAALQRETTERARAEDLLRQAQKMEAIGQLTGGIAHDFNNLLTIVIANLDRVRRLSEGDAKLERPVINAIAGAERATRLTSQLLAFSRRQPLIAADADLSALVAGMHALIGASVPAGIAVVTDLDPDVWPVRIDANQLENALLNLVVNARDAMPDGGTLTVRTRNLAAVDGDRVVVEIADTGTGMPPEVVARVFEPFFTTKGVGKGTGLGLSQVQGFVEQSGGRVAITSGVGQGTTIAIELPRAGDPMGLQ